jgi:hypothetical protein
VTRSDTRTRIAFGAKPLTLTSTIRGGDVLYQILFMVSAAKATALTGNLGLGVVASFFFRYGTLVFLTLVAFANLKVSFINNNNGAYKKQKILGTLASEGARYLFLATSTVELGGSTS